MSIDYDSIKKMAIKQKLNPLGAHLLHEYYSNSQQTGSKDKVDKRFYNINDPKPYISAIDAEADS